MAQLAQLARRAREISPVQTSAAVHSSPLNHPACPGEAAAEHNHQDVIAAFDSPGAVRFIERNRYGGSRRIAVSIEVHEHFIPRNAEPIGDRLNDSQAS